MGARGVPSAVGQQGRGPHRRGRVPADGGRRAGEGGVARPRHRLLLLAGARAHARGRARDRPKPARGAGRAYRRPRSHLERRPGSGLQPLAPRGAGDGGAVQPEKPDPLRVRLLRSVHALPSREDDRHRRPRRIRRRHRPHAGRWRPVRQPGAPLARSDRLARRRDAHRRARGRRCRRPLSPALARGSQGGSFRSSGSRRCRQGRPPARPHDSRERVRALASARRLHGARVLCGRLPLGRAVHLHREPVPLVVRDRRDPRGEACAIRPARTSASSSSSR